MRKQGCNEKIKLCSCRVLSAEKLQGNVEAIGKKVWSEMKSEELQLIHAVAEDIAGISYMQ